MSIITASGYTLQRCVSRPQAELQPEGPNMETACKDQTNGERSGSDLFACIFDLCKKTVHFIYSVRVTSWL